MQSECARNSVHISYLFKERGRWHFDMAYIYQPALVKTHLDAAAQASAAQGSTMESICNGTAGLR